jgi:Tfp pilus assembly protein PilO
MVESLKEARDAAAAKLGSAKAANAELAKKVDALSKQLPTQNNASSKTN